MDFPLPAKITNLLVSTGKLAQDPLSLKIGQLIEVKVLDVSLKKNIIALQLGKTTFEAQPQPSLSSLQNSPQTQVILKSGETLKAQVTKLTPEPELKIEKASIPPEQVNPLKPSISKHQQTNPSSQIDAKPLTLKILNNPDIVTKTVDQKTPALQVGQKIPAKIITINHKQIQFQLIPEQKANNISQQKPLLYKIEIPQPQPQIKIGQTVSLEVTKAGLEPQFKISDNKLLALTAPNKLITETLKQKLPIQQPPEVFINQLIKNLPVISKNTNLPETLQRLAQHILRNLPAKSQLSQPKGIKQSINNSGLFLEAKLLPSESSLQLNTQADYKANLIKFLQTLKQLPTATPQPKVNTPTLETSGLKQLQNNGDSSVAKLVLDQLNSLPKEDSPKQIWHIEIPYIEQENAQPLSLQIEKDKEKNADQGKENWSATITLTPSGLGKLYCKISCYNQTISTHFWSDLPKTANLINHNLEYLKTKLEASGLKIGSMESRQDIPIQPTNPSVSGINLVDEQI